LPIHCRLIEFEFALAGCWGKIDHRQPRQELVSGIDIDALVTEAPAPRAVERLKMKADG
jgi:hypothetical protein